MGAEAFILTVLLLGLGALLLLSLWRLVLLILVHGRQKDLTERLTTLERSMFKLVDTLQQTERRQGSRQQPVSAEPEGRKAPAARPPAPTPPPVPTPVETALAKARPAPPPEAVVPGGAAHPSRPSATPPESPPPPSPPPSPRPPGPEPGPREPGAVAEALHRVEEAALSTLRKVWNWIIVGEDYRDPGKTVEYAVATTWLVRLGVVLIVVGIGYGFAYSFEHNLIHEGGRVALGILTAVAMIVGGLRILGKRYHLLGQGLIGGGLATLYVTIFAAHHFYGLVTSVWIVFALMGVVTAAAGVLAVGVDSLLIAVLGIVGGYGTPFVLAGSGAGYGSFFGYLLVLGLGIVAIGHYRKWILLNYLGMAFTFVHVIRVLQRHYQAEHFVQVMPFLVAFFALYSAVVIVYNVVHRQPCNLIEILGLFVNSAVFFGLGYRVISQSFERDWASLLSLALAAFYVLLVYVFLRRGMTDRTLLLTLMALAGFYVAITMPLLLSRQWLTVSWAVQAFVMLWLSRKVDSRFLQALACSLYALVVFRLFAFDMAGAFRGGAVDQPLRAYVLDLCERLVIFGVPVASFFGAWRLHRPDPVRTGPVTVSREADTAILVPRSAAVAAFILVAAIAAFVYLHLELNRMFAVVFEPLRLPVITALWVALAAGLMSARGIPFSRRWVSALIWASITIILMKLFFVDLQSWGFSLSTMRFGTRYVWIEAAMRLLDFGMVVALAAWLAGNVRSDRPTGARVFAGLAFAVGFLFLTFEVNTFVYHYIPGFQAGGLSILWSAFALGLVLQGIRRRVRVLRLCGLVLFAVVFVKIFFVDLAHLTALHRMIALVIMGIIILLGSFIYLRNAEAFAQREHEEAS